ncbi:MAG: histone deacetylase [Gammaproteobacteria bacterium]
MRVSYHPDYFVELPQGHPFPMAKFPGLYEILLAEGVVAPGGIVRPKEADMDLLRLVHTDEYLWKLSTGNLSRTEERRVGIPWSEGLWRRSRLAVAGTVNAGLMALEDGCAGNLAGGTHHAFPDHGQGFCVLNDVAICVRHLRRLGRIRRALVVDLDVHQGNGTAAIFHNDPEAYTFSIHGEKNFPARKTRSTLDIGLPCGTGDDRYMEVLREALTRAIAESGPDCVFYLAGVDPAEGDRYGRMRLTRDGLERRDRFVLETVRDAGLPIVLLLSGGYAATPVHTAELHAIVFRQAKKVFLAHRSRAATG